MNRLKILYEKYIYLTKFLFFNFSHKNKKILITGMPQSGSTFITNIIVQLLIKHQTKSYVFLSGKILNNDGNTINQTLLRKFSKGIIILKEHHYIQYLDKWADIKIVCQRSIDKSINSRIKRKKNLFRKVSNIKSKKIFYTLGLII